MNRSPAGPPLQLRVLGAIELQGESADVDRVLAQPSRFALLVYLVLRRPGGFVRRDELVGVFWPESTDSRARAALRQAVHYLRVQLGEEVIVGRGSGALGIAPETIDCDALRFRRDLDAGHDRAALDRYGGELLPGFLLSDAPTFERWLERERRRLAGAAVDASLRAAREAEERGNLTEAVRWTRRAMDIDPTREAVARRLISLLDRTGDRASAVATYERLATRLREELDVEPAPETSELVETVRSRTGADADHEPGERAGSGELDARRVLVAPLENLTEDPSLGALGGLVADWVADRLAVVPELDVVPPVLLPLHQAPSPDVDDEAKRVEERALAAQAGTVVSGAYYAEGDDLRYELRIIDLVGGSLLTAPEPLRVPRQRPLEGITRLHERVLTGLAPELSSRSVHVRAGERPPSYEAYRAYIEGLDAFIQGRWSDALGRFRRAIDLEPEYPLPRITAAIAHWNLSELDEARAVAREADAMRSGLGRFERSVLDMVLAWLRGDWVAAHEAATLQAELAEGSISHFQVAEEARRLNRPREAVKVLSRLEPETGELKGLLFYWIELGRSLHLLGEHARELEEARHARRLHPDHPAATFLEIRALAALGRLEPLREILEVVQRSPGERRPWTGELLRETALELRIHGRETEARGFLDDAVDWFAERVDAESPTPLRREYARTLYLADRLVEARNLFELLAAEAARPVAPVGFHHGHLQAHVDTGYLAVIAAHQGDDDEAERRAEGLRSLDLPFGFGAAWFWLAALAAVRGEARRACSYLRRAFSEGLPHEMFLHTDPHLALLRGDPVFEALMRPRG